MQWLCWHKFSAGSHTCNGCGGTSLVLAATHTMVVVAQGTMREVVFNMGKKMLQMRTRKSFRKLCYAANKMHFVKHESSSGYVKEPMMKH